MTNCQITIIATGSKWHTRPIHLTACQATIAVNSLSSMRYLNDCKTFDLLFFCTGRPCFVFLPGGPLHSDRLHGHLHVTIDSLTADGNQCVVLVSSLAA